MKDTRPTANRYDWLWLGIICFFFFQLLTDFVAAVYAFGLLGTDIPPEIVTVVVFSAPALLLLFRRAPARRGQLALIGLIMLTSIAEVLLDTRGRLLVTGLGVGACLVWLPVWLFDTNRATEVNDSTNLGLGVSVGLALTLAAKARPTEPSFGLTLVWAIWAAQALLSWLRHPDRSARPINSTRPRFLVTTGLALGLMAALTLLYFAFTSPNVIARWTGADFGLVLVLVVLALSAFALGHRWLLHMPRNTILIWNATFVIALTATLLAHHIDFPVNPGAYPLAEPIAPGWASVTLALTCLLFPVILLDVSVYSRELIARQPSLRALGGSFTRAGLFLLLMIFAQVFTTVYDYIPVVGPLFRDRFWLVFAVLGVVMALPLLMVRSIDQSSDKRSSRDLAFSITILGALALFSVAWSSRQPAGIVTQPTKLRVVTYNIQQGYDAEGQLNRWGQFALMSWANPDVIGLQESDTNRIAGGNADLVRYFADKLGFHSFYGPKVGAGTFGIALLSRYPIENPRVVYFYSAGEQTAAIIATITAGSKRFQVIVTHLGNDGPIVQQQALLQSIDQSLPVIAMGDFNFRPDSEQYRLTRTRLDDAWLLRWPNGVDDQGRSMSDRIDHVFVSPGTLINGAEYMETPDSDHPALWVELGW
ncbi:MAG: endonuclease/exonuclease/phosphatase family protein [Chloroflexi bacterium]|nr:endonuclease/exonuclease/phosphatase family protein [Chloroflexota bacterium]